MLFYIGSYFFPLINNANEDGTWSWRGPNRSWSHVLRTPWRPKRSWRNSPMRLKIRADRRPAVRYQPHANPAGRGATPPRNPVQQNGRYTQPRRPHLAGGSVHNTLWRWIFGTKTQRCFTSTSRQSRFSPTSKWGAQVAMPLNSWRCIMKCRAITLK